MKLEWEQGDRVVVIGNEEHGTVIKVRVDDNGVPLVDVQLDNEWATPDWNGVWVARAFELREEEA